MGKTAGSDYLDLDCRSLTLVPQDYAAWLLDMEYDGPLNVLSTSKGLFTLLTGQEPPFKEALDWLQLSYTSDQVGGYVAPVSTVLAHSEIAEGGQTLSRDPLSYQETLS